PNVRSVTPGYFRAMSIAAVRGRLLGDEDAGSSQLVGVVNETASRMIWRGANPIGQQVRFSPTSPWISVVGVARDVRSVGLGGDVRPEIYLLPEQLREIAETTERAMYVVLRTAGDPSSLAAAARRTVRSF